MWWITLGRLTVSFKWACPWYLSRSPVDEGGIWSIQVGPVVLEYVTQTGV